jgi:hypothetical protein
MSRAPAQAPVDDILGNLRASAEPPDLGAPAYEAALKANGKTYTVYLYEGTEATQSRSGSSLMRRSTRQAATRSR